MMWERAIILAIGFGIGTVDSYMRKDTVIENAYRDGYLSAMNRPVEIRGGDENCTVELTVGSLAELVNIGIMEWHEACKAAFERLKENPK